MLVLKRTVGRSIIINVNGVKIRVIITRQNETGVWIGIDAPREVVVDREEVYARRVRHVNDD
jgi:carbon storage regulator